MMPSDYISLKGEIRSFDLDSIYEIVRGFSKQRLGWTSTVVFDPVDTRFIEIRTSPEDVRGSFQDEAEEVDDSYLFDAYGIDSSELMKIRRKPDAWQLVNRR